MIGKKVMRSFKKLVICLFLLKRVSLGALAALEIEKIGMQIWYNEAAGKEDLLVFWNQNEAFPSLGIGHNIWLPAGQKVKFHQGFPILCDYLKKHGVRLPDWLEQAKKNGAPWQTREHFYQDYARRNELRKILVQTVALQTQFMIDLMTQKLPLIVQAVPNHRRKHLEKNINLMLATPKGTYALVDYLNFKGDGLNPREELNGERWGLLAVLLDMPNDLNQNNVLSAFAESASQKLLNRIKNDHKLETFKVGWLKRLQTYVN
jgi:hypothetical protein